MSAEITLPMDDDVPSSIGAILIGFPSRSVDKLAIRAKLPMEGSIDISGNEAAPLNVGALSANLSLFVTEHRLQALAVSGVNSGMNPAHEIEAAKIARSLVRLPTIEARFWRRERDALQRALAAARGAHQWLFVRETLATIGTTVPIRLLNADEAFLSAVAAADVDQELRHIDLRCNTSSFELEARITRASSDIYACHCDDGRFDFDSLTAAKRFGEEHLRKQIVTRARQVGFPPPVVNVQINDRFTKIKGKKGSVRVYLETHLIARADVGNV